MVRSVAAASAHPVAVEATGEVAGALLDGGGVGADLLLVLAGASFRGALEDVCGALDRLVSPRHCVGVAAGTVIGGGRVFDRAGLVVLALHGGRWTARRPSVDGQDAPPGAATVHLSPREPDGRADPLHLPVVPATGQGSPAGSAIPGSMWLDGSEAADGIVLAGDAHGAAVVGLAPWTPLDPPRAVVSADATVLRSLGGRPAAEVLVEAIEGAGPAPAAGLLEIGLRRQGGQVVGIAREPAGPWARTSVPLVVGETVEVVVRRVVDAVAGLSALRRERGRAAMLLVSSELHAGAGVGSGAPEPVPALGAALAAAGGAAMLGLAVEPVTGRPRSEVMVVA